MELALQKIGNSRGILLPKKLIDSCGIRDKVEVFVTGKSITITPKKKTRDGWAEAASRMHKAGEDSLLIPDNLDDDVWEEWKE